jgi:1-phosphofructokinase
VTHAGDNGGSIVVFAPAPVLTITVEARGERPEVHLHAGGQGFWVAHLAATLGSAVTLCCALGGEPGRVLRGLIETTDGLRLRPVEHSAPNGVYIHDRRGGSREEVVNVESRPLGRHTADELYGVALGAGLDADLTLITGSQPSDVLPADLYRRLVSDLRANGKRVIADVTGPPLRATLEGGVDLLRISESETVGEGYASDTALRNLLHAGTELLDAGAGDVIISRASEPAILISREDRSHQIELVGPVFEALDHTGTGDSMFAATGVGLARGMSVLGALRLGMAAGALNATRRGLGTGTRQEIEQLAAHVRVRPLDDLGQQLRR